MRLASLIAFCCATVLLITAGPAVADSLVFSRDNNIWLSNADGSGQYQVTLDGTPSSPYTSPSQADDGTIVALRTPPGGRPQIWRMSQNGGLLNPPINTPAPGTGAIDARVSPNGQLVAYWFVTTVNDPGCVFCVNAASQALISRSNAFTNPDDVGNPHFGGWPSWMSNNEILLGSGSPSQWTYTIGQPEAVQWWGDTPNCDACTPPAPVTLLDAEVSRDGSEVAVVRGDNQETIATYTTNNGTANDPTPRCGLIGPTGKFQNPTWSQDGHTLAWSEGDGIWSDGFPSPTDCTGQPHLIIPGASEPDFGPAAVNPGSRPPCGNPGNPAACPTPTPPCCSPADYKARLNSLLSAELKALKKLKIRGLLRKHQVKVSFTAPAPGTLALKLTASGAAAKKKPVVIASGRASFPAAGKKTVVLKLTSKGKKVLKHKRKLKATLSATFTPTGGVAISAKRTVSLKR